MTIRELYRLNRLQWLGPGGAELPRERKKYYLEMVTFHTIQDWLVECQGLHPDDGPGWGANAILQGEHARHQLLKPLRALLRFANRLDRRNATLDTKEPKDSAARTSERTDIPDPAWAARTNARRNRRRR